MAIRVYNPTSPGRRNASVNLYSEVTKKTPEKTLLKKLTKTGGRNHKGVITVRHRGGGHKRRYRVIDFKRNKLDVPAKVIGIEYDPNRTCNIALLEYADGERRYIIAPIGLTDGMEVISGANAVEPTVGNSMRIRNIPPGLTLHNVELEPGKGGQMGRAAGVGVRLLNKEGKWATLILPSGEIRQVSLECRATIGQVGNTDHQNVKLGKAGRKRWMGIRPSVRGMAMSHHAHPLGGGEGRSKGGRSPCSPTGVPAKGGPTRDKVKASNKRIIRRRRSKRYGIQRLSK
ncbi:MAG: 50S ribosomal protein L2 [Phycisphaera sp.]|nr:50S ribosomal protein L2 [Phycisphaera sp.]